MSHSLGDSVVKPPSSEDVWRCYCGLDVPTARVEAHTSQCEPFEEVSDRRLLNLVRRLPPRVVVERVADIVKALQRPSTRRDGPLSALESAGAGTYTEMAEKYDVSEPAPSHGQERHGATSRVVTEGVAVSALAAERGDVRLATSKLRSSPSYLQSMVLAQNVSQTARLVAKLRAAPMPLQPVRSAPAPPNADARALAEGAAMAKAEARAHARAEEEAATKATAEAEAKAKAEADAVAEEAARAEEERLMIREDEAAAAVEAANAEEIKRTFAAGERLNALEVLVMGKVAAGALKKRIKLLEDNILGDEPLNTTNPRVYQGVMERIGNLEEAVGTVEELDPEPEPQDYEHHVEFSIELHDHDIASFHGDHQAALLEILHGHLDGHLDGHAVEIEGIEVGSVVVHMRVRHPPGSEDHHTEKTVDLLSDHSKLADKLVS